MKHDDIRLLTEIACEWAYEKYAKRETGYSKEYWQFYKFAALVVDAEREACAKICEGVDLKGREVFAYAIRTKGKVK